VDVVAGTDLNRPSPIIKTSNVQNGKNTRSKDEDHARNLWRAPWTFDSSPRGRSALSQILRWMQHPAVRFATTALCVWLLVRSIDLHKAFNSLLGASPFWLATAVVLTGCVLASQTIIWGLFLRCNGHNLSWPRLGSLYLQGLFWSHAIPGAVGGDAVRVVKTAEYVGEGEALASLAASRLAEGVGIMGVGAVAVVTLHSWFGAIAYVIAAAIVLALASGWYLLLMADSISAWLDAGDDTPLRKRFSELLRKFGAACKGYRQHPRQVVMCLVIGIVCWLLNLGAMMSFSHAIHAGVPWNVFAVMVPMSAVTALAPFAINGFGLREGLVVAILSKAGIGLNKAFAVALLIDMQMLPFVLIGGLLWLLERRKEGDSKE
jgi:glycosyltransferase 2 family protein